MTTIITPVFIPYNNQPSEFSRFFVENGLLVEITVNTTNKSAADEIFQKIQSEANLTPTSAPNDDVPLVPLLFATALICFALFAFTMIFGVVLETAKLISFQFIQQTYDPWVARCFIFGTPVILLLAAIMHHNQSRKR